MKQLLALAWPIMISRSTQSVVSICDAIMVSSLGSAALGATSTGAFNTMTFLILPVGVMFIVSSFSSQFTGQGDPAGARRYGWYGLIVALGMQLLVGAMLPLIPYGLGLFSYADDVRELMTSYMQIRLLSIGAATGLEALGNYYGGIGNTRLPMLTSLFAMVINVLFCWMFIHGHWGAPALGVRGAALGNVVATSLAFLVLFAVFLRQGWQNRTSRAATSRRLHLHELWRMLRFGLPSGFNWLFEFLAFSFFINVIVTALGTSALAAMMSVLDLNSVAFMPAFGLASAGAIITGQQIGARALDQVPATLKLTLKATVAWQGTVGLIYIGLPALVLRAFDTHDPAFSYYGRRVLFMAGLWQVADATLTTYAETLRAAGDTTFTLLARMIVAWGLFVPGVLITVRVFDGNDIAASAWVIAYLALTASVLALRFKQGKWRSVNLTGVPT